MGNKKNQALPQLRLVNLRENPVLDWSPADQMQDTVFLRTMSLNLPLRSVIVDYAGSPSQAGGPICIHAATLIPLSQIDSA
ncbi:hypothetical protein ABU162_26990 [Paenibacillus thiaminolyticus]|uniref:hypothetical protein n=1 Tax=Paenibacillus thiaminolyticus TaxID=49283 RepID=UPI0035A72E68